MMYRRIRKVIKDKEVLEIATGPGVIAKQVADEAKSMIAPNFVHDNQKKASELFSKMLSTAGVEFKSKWSMAGYLAFLEENGFEVTGANQLSSTIPLAYAECKKRG